MSKMVDKFLNVLGFELIDETNEIEEAKMEERVPKEVIKEKKEKNETWYNKMSAKISDKPENTERPELKQRKRGEVINLPGVQKVKMVISRPTSFNDINIVSNHLKDNDSVVVDLTEVTAEEARRILDYLSGVVFAIGGQARRVGTGIFLLVPANITIEGSAEINESLFKNLENEETVSPELNTLLKTIGA